MATMSQTKLPPPRSYDEIKADEAKAKKQKTTQPSTATEALPKDCGWLEYLHDEAFRFFPAKEEWRKRIIFSMYEFLESLDEKGRVPIDVMQFCRRYKIPYDTLLYWAKKYADIGKAYADMKLFLAANRRLGTMHKELDKDAVYKDQHKYDPEWDAINKYHAALKNEEGATQGIQTVYLREVASTGKIKPKKEKNNDPKDS